MSNLAKVELPVKATLIYNFGKFDYCYKPLDEKGEKMLAMVIACSTKPTSTRKNFSKADVLNAIKLTKPNNISLEFIVKEVNAPTALPATPELNKPISFVEAVVAPTNVDLGFLG